MENNDDHRIMIELLQVMDRKVDNLASKLDGKADNKEIIMIHKRIDKANEKVDSLNKKMNWASGVGSTLLGLIGLGDFFK